MIPLWILPEEDDEDTFSYKKHQVDGIHWMIEQEKQETPFCGGFLCDEMGLGKTVEVLGLIKNNAVKRTLMMGPIAVLTQWKELAQKSKINTFIVDRTKYQWMAATKIYVSQPSVYIINYECAIRHPSLISIFTWDRLVLDEAHRLANHKSLVHKTVLNIATKRRWIVTGTPIVNGLNDARSLLAIGGMDPLTIPYGIQGMLPIVQEKAICRSVNELRPFMTDLPKPPIIHIHTLSFESPEEQLFYRSIQGKLVAKLNIMIENGSEQWMILKLMLMLRQLSVNPQVYINARRREMPDYPREDWKSEGTKFSALKNIITAQMEQNHRWIVFCQFHDEMDILKKYLNTLPRIKRVQTYSGKNTPDERDKIIQRTKEPLYGAKNTEVLLVQLQSGSVGLNLQHFDRIAFISPWWTAALMDQAIGRAVRIGQKKSVEVHHLRLQEESSMNIDALMIEKVEAKRELCSWFLMNASRGIPPPSLLKHTDTSDEEGDDPLAGDDPCAVGSPQNPTV